MRIRVLSVIFLLSVGFSSGCYFDKSAEKVSQTGGGFQIVEGQDGQIYRLNRSTGQLFAVRGGVMVPVEQIDEKIAAGEYGTELEKPRYLGEQQMPGENLRCALKTSWQAGNLYFSLKVYPFESLEKLYEEKVAHYGKMIIHLRDADGFTVLQVPISLTDMTEIMDDQGKVEYLSFSSGGPFSAQLYRDIDDYYVVWKMKSDLIPDAGDEAEAERKE